MSNWSIVRVPTPATSRRIDAAAAPSEKPRPVRGFSFLARASSPLGAWVFGLLLGALYVAAIVALRLRTPFTDEIDHFTQITHFPRGTNRILTELTTIPGYRALVAAITRACGADPLDAARLLNENFDLFAVAGFHALRPRSPMRRHNSSASASTSV
ncbi:MAG: hypothetical protein ACTHK2_13335 [Dokdonella sp.]|uniref:hypothetical protein n=1 Tax=Dokdonella sp. TaxID=2291710 RepID=UPI003F81734F